MIFLRLLMNPTAVAALVAALIGGAIGFQAGKWFGYYDGVAAEQSAQQARNVIAADKIKEGIVNATGVDLSDDADLGRLLELLTGN